MRNPGWAAAALTATALAVTACGPSSYSSGAAGGAYGTPTGSSSQTSTSGATAQTSALKVTRTSAGSVLASSRGLTLYYYTEDKPGSGSSVVYRQLRQRLAAAGRAGPRPGRRTSARPARDDHPARRRRAGHHQRLPHLHLRRGQGPGAGHVGNGIEGAWHVIKIP